MTRATGRPLGPGRTVWLASYPKSGNTWVRAILTALEVGEHLFAIDHLGSGSQPFHVSGSLATFGLDPRWLCRDQVDLVRTALVLRAGQAQDPRAGEHPAAGPAGLPFMRKTHEVFRAGWPDPFPLAATRAAILVVRDPRDVACSYAHFFGVDHAAAVQALATASPKQANPAHMTTAQPWGSWSSHARSWLGPEVPFPVLQVRYEDLRVDAVAALLPVLAGVGLPVTEQALADAVARTAFERLAQAEQERGFRETSPATTTFFRRGLAGGWRDELAPELVAVVETDHAEVMADLGYALAGSPHEVAALARVRQDGRGA